MKIAAAVVNPLSFVCTELLIDICPPGHPSCIHLDELGDIVRSYPWRCSECKICEICHEKGDDVSHFCFDSYFHFNRPVGSNIALRFLRQGLVHSIPNPTLDLALLGRLAYGLSDPSY